MKIISYVTPQEFLHKTLHVLEENEVENNLIIGLCNGLIQTKIFYEGCVFINAIENGIVKASSIKTLHKAIVTNYDESLFPIKAIAEYYRDNNIDLRGVVGKSSTAKEFSKWYGKEVVGEKGLIVHTLETVNPLPLSLGSLEIATIEDNELITEWSIEFEKDVKAFPKTSYEEMSKSVTRRIESGNFYKWVVSGEIVSIAAIVRTLTNTCIIGLVYTPPHLRGNGFATSCVQRLSEIILDRGYKYCGLFTDKANPTSNNIYKKIGYVPIEEHSDIEFLE